MLSQGSLVVAHCERRSQTDARYLRSRLFPQGKSSHRPPLQLKFKIQNLPMPPILLGNSFPLSLIRRAVRIDQRTVAELRQAVGERGCVSFWGHGNTLEAAKTILGFDPTLPSLRPALTLNGDGFPSLNGAVFEEVWVLSPDYREGFRPAIGCEVTPDQIVGWQILRLKFTDL